jgi:hypothetical protein
MTNGMISIFSIVNFADLYVAIFYFHLHMVFISLVYISQLIRYAIKSVFDTHYHSTDIAGVSVVSFTWYIS